MKLARVDISDDGIATVEFSLGNVYKSANLLQEAVDAYVRAIAADANHNGAALNLGIALESQVLFCVYYLRFYFALVWSCCCCV